MRRQHGIKKKLALYLEFTQRDETTPLRKLLISEGHCFGFAVTYAAMFYLGKIKWWESVLYHIVEWDETIASLDQMVKLPDSNHPLGEKLSQIFFKALNFIVINQVDDSADQFQPKHYSQFNYFEPVNEFTILGDQNTQHKAQFKECLAGFFYRADLNTFLNEKYLQDKICLLHNNNHTINLCSDGVNWILYNANYDHNGIGKTAKIFASKHTLIDEIVRILGHAIAIEVVHFTMPSKVLLSPLEQYFRDSLQDIHKSMQFLIGQGLHVMASHYRKKLLQVLTAAKSNPDFPKKIAKALVSEDSHGWSGLHNIMRYAPNCFELILGSLKCLNGGPQYLYRGLNKKSKGKAGLYYIVTKATNTLTQVFDFLKTKPELFTDVARTLKSLVDEQNTGFQIITKYAYSHVLVVLNYFKAAGFGAELLVAVLGGKNKDDKNGLETLVSKCSQFLPDMIDFIATNKDASETFLQLLKKKSKHEICIVTIIKNLPDFLVNILGILATNKQLIEHYLDLIKLVLETLADKAVLTECLKYILKHFPYLGDDLYELIMKHSDATFLGDHAVLILQHATTTLQIREFVGKIESLRPDGFSEQMPRIITQAQMKMSRIFLTQGCQISEEDKQFLLRHPPTFTLFNYSALSTTQTILHSYSISTRVIGVK